MVYGAAQTVEFAFPISDRASCDSTPVKTLNPLRLLLVLGICSCLLGGCGVNPVTGQSEMSLLSEAQEIQIGAQQYVPSQQSQGGLYYVDPELASYVDSVGQNLARVSDRPRLPYEFVVINSSVPNAWALPGGKIAVNRGLLLALEDEAQLAAVLGHEIVHAAARHGAKQQETGMLLGAGLAVLGMASAGTAYQDVLMQGAQLGSTMIQMRYSREAELEADYYGMQYMSRAGYDPQGAVRLQETFVRLNTSGRGDWLNGLFASHPPSQERVDANRRSAERLPDGSSGREEYQRHIARLKRDKPAYDAYDQAVAAMNARRFGEALGLADRAIGLQERESLFHELRGLALMQQDKAANAVRSYNRAIALNPNFFRHYLFRGMFHLKSRNLDLAAQDLEQSNRLLPTAEATYGLGEVAARQGDARTAIAYFEPVARSQSPLAPAARDWILKLRGGAY